MAAASGGLDSTRWAGWRLGFARVRISNFALAIPVGGPTVQSGLCTMTHDATLFAVAPHMHQLGVHFKAVAHSSLMGEVVLSDRPYNFDAQINSPLTPGVQMKAGDTVSIECTYQNTTGHEVTFGESSLSEICFAGLYRYPAGDGSSICLLWSTEQIETRMRSEDFVLCASAPAGTDRAVRAKARRVRAPVQVTRADLGCCMHLGQACAARLTRVRVYTNRRTPRARPA